MEGRGFSQAFEITLSRRKVRFYLPFFTGRCNAQCFRVATSVEKASWRLRDPSGRDPNQSVPVLFKNELHKISIPQSLLRCSAHDTSINKLLVWYGIL